MSACEYRDLAGFGLRLVGPENEGFEGLVRDIERLPQLFPFWPEGTLKNPAVLLNESGKDVVILAYAYRYGLMNGRTVASQFVNLGSSMQIDLLEGRCAVPQDLNSCILSGAKRLLTEQGMFGNNLDVLPADQENVSSCFAFGGGPNQARHEPIASTELGLDLAIFDDGLCVGPDPEGIAAGLAESLEARRQAAAHAAAAIRSGETEGKIFEILLPYVRRANPYRQEMVFLAMFGQMAISTLIEKEREEQLVWFENCAEAPRKELHGAV